MLSNRTDNNGLWRKQEGGVQADINPVISLLLDLKDKKLRADVGSGWEVGLSRVHDEEIPQGGRA